MHVKSSQSYSSAAQESIDISFYIQGWHIQKCSTNVKKVEEEEGRDKLAYV
jgi:hypothetical protein